MTLLAVTGLSHTLILTVNIKTATGWGAGSTFVIKQRQVHPPPALFLGTGRAQSPPSATTGGAPSSQKKITQRVRHSSLHLWSTHTGIHKEPGKPYPKFYIFISQSKTKRRKKKTFRLRNTRSHKHNLINRSWRQQSKQPSFAVREIWFKLSNWFW